MESSWPPNCRDNARKDYMELITVLVICQQQVANLPTVKTSHMIGRLDRAAYGWLDLVVPQIVIFW